MIITDRLKSFLKPPHEVITSEHINTWSDLTYDKDGSELKGWIDNPFIIKFYFETGWVFFNMTSKDTSHIYSMYKHPDTKETREEIISILRDFYKQNGIKRVTMQTKLPAEFWQDKYGFEFKANLMEIKV
jgi:hypothetical protein|tara:strand:- start:278 stop:667 length:390 start_codon:yes stop_codon:yes gene_type:complete